VLDLTQGQSSFRHRFALPALSAAVLVVGAVLTSLGPGTRRSLVLVLHDSAQPWMTVTTDWRPIADCADR
jgi:hypothetical protein